MNIQIINLRKEGRGRTVHWSFIPYSTILNDSLLPTISSPNCSLLPPPPSHALNNLFWPSETNLFPMTPLMDHLFCLGLSPHWPPNTNSCGHAFALICSLTILTFKGFPPTFIDLSCLIQCSSTYCLTWSPVSPEVKLLSLTRIWTPWGQGLLLNPLHF